MPAKVEDQLRQLGRAYDEFVTDVSPTEVAPTPTREPVRHRRAWLLSAAACVLVVAVVAAVARVNRPQIDTALPAAVPADLLPADATHVDRLLTDVGWLELYELPDSDQRCLYLRALSVAHGGCWDESYIAAGSAVESLIVAGERVVFGLLPASEDSRAALQVGTVPMEEEVPIPPDGERTVEADANGIWYLAARDTETHFVTETPCCQTIGPIPLPANAPEVLPSVPATAAPSTGAPGSTTVPIFDIGADWVLRGSVAIELGRFDIYDATATREVCVTRQYPAVGVPRSGASSCFGRDEVDRGLAWSAAVEDPGAALWGIAPLGVGFEATVGPRTAVPDDLGFWHVVLTDNVSEFTIVTPSGAQVIPLGAPMITVPNSTTAPLPDIVVPTALPASGIDGIRTTPDERRLLVWFTGAAEYESGNHCSMHYEAAVAESPTEVRLSIGGRHPAQVSDDECGDKGHFRHLAVALSEPLGERSVAFLGETLDIVDGAALLSPTWLPEGWGAATEGSGFLAAPTWRREWRSSASGACVAGLNGIELVEGPSAFLAEFPRDERETDVGPYDIDDAVGRVFLFPTRTGARLEWIDAGRGYVIRASLCGADEDESIASLLRFARGLRVG